jgi:hypothetical protein
LDLLFGTALAQEESDAQQELISIICTARHTSAEAGKEDEKAVDPQQWIERV